MRILMLLVIMVFGLSEAKAQVTVSPSGVVTALDGDSTCDFTIIGDGVSIDCFAGAALKFHAFVALKVGDPVGNSFVRPAHTIAWSLERESKGGGLSSISFDVSLDGVHFTGVF